MKEETKKIVEVCINKLLSKDMSDTCHLKVVKKGFRLTFTFGIDDKLFKGLYVDLDDDFAINDLKKIGTDVVDFWRGWQGPQENIFVGKEIKPRSILNYMEEKFEDIIVLVHGNKKSGKIEYDDDKLMAEPYYISISWEEKFEDIDAKTLENFIQNHKSDVEKFYSVVYSLIDSADRIISLESDTCKYIEDGEIKK